MHKHLYLDFERPVAELEGKIEELRHLSADVAAGLNIAEEVGRLAARVDKQLRVLYGRLTPWQRTQVARHPDRPHCHDYIDGLFEDFIPLAGDRLFGEDPAIIGGIGRCRGFSTLVVGQEKGTDTESRVHCNFGMARPEGYRKAARLVRLADRFRLPVVTLVDTAGAFPGVEAEARGQAAAIAGAIEACLEVRVPVVSVIIGEGGSGGALALAVANTVLMLENAVYSVISPEGCAASLWRANDHVQAAAEALKLTAEDLLRLGVIDTIVAEPLGGAHRDKAAAVAAAGDGIEAALKDLVTLEGGVLRARRREKFLAMGRDLPG